ARRRQVRGVALKVPLRRLALARLRQRDDAHLARVQPLGDGVDRATLAGGVAALEQDHHPLAGVRQPVREVVQLELERLERFLVLLLLHRLHRSASARACRTSGDYACWAMIARCPARSKPSTIPTACCGSRPRPSSTTCRRCARASWWSTSRRASCGSTTAGNATSRTSASRAPPTSSASRSRRWCRTPGCGTWSRPANRSCSTSSRTRPAPTWCRA